MPIKKLETETQLNSKTTVRKSDPRIIFRGKLDSLLSTFILTQRLLKDLGESDLYEYFNDFYGLIKKMIYADATETPIPEMTLLNLSEAELREMSHHPKKYFDIPHLFEIDSTYSIAVLTLNSLRTAIREAELNYIMVLDFTGQTECTKGFDKYLNRLSSAVYILMCVYASGKQESFKEIINNKHKQKESE